MQCTQKSLSYSRREALRVCMGIRFFPLIQALPNESGVRRAVPLMRYWFLSIMQ